LLARWRANEARPLLHRLGKGDEGGSELRKAALFALADFQDPAALGMALDRDSAIETWERACILGRYDDARARKALSDMMAETPESGRGFIVRTLAEAGDAQAIDHYLTYFAEGWKRLHDSSFDGFERIAEFEAFFAHPLVAREGGYSGGEVEAAFRAFITDWPNRKRGFNVRKVHLDGLSSSTRRLREYSVAWFRSQKAAPDVLDRIKAMMRDVREEGRVRRAAAVTLIYQRGDSEALEFLIPLKESDCAHHVDWRRMSHEMMALSGRAFFGSRLRDWFEESEIFKYGEDFPRVYEWFQSNRTNLKWNSQRRVFEIHR
jgi:hypothetical protein